MRIYRSENIVLPDGSLSIKGLTFQAGNGGGSHCAPVSEETEIKWSLPHAWYNIFGAF